MLFKADKATLFPAASVVSFQSEYLWVTGAFAGDFLNAEDVIISEPLWSISALAVGLVREGVAMLAPVIVTDREAAGDVMPPAEVCVTSTVYVPPAQTLASPAAVKV